MVTQIHGGNTNRRRHKKLEKLKMEGKLERGRRGSRHRGELAMLSSDSKPLGSEVWNGGIAGRESSHWIYMSAAVMSRNFLSGASAR